MQKDILCFGDSNTWGYIPGLAERYPREIRWTGRLQRMLGEEYYVIEDGQNSRTIVWDDPVTGYKNGLTYLIPCLEAHKPLDAVVIMLGTNDMQERFQLNGFNIARSMERMVDAVQFSRAGRGGQAPKLLLIAPPLIRDNLYETPLGENLGAGCIERSRETAPHLKLLCEQTGIWFLDAQTVAEASPEDAVHMDEQGHKALAEAVRDMILKMEI
ncbi:SGNH/GDSL hydrolase family protein [Bacilliculturomica massiliensis]|uniref:SGNH/GDSL hydrolase family protein n=1 Tax=Bacilliculturomica massiliensis TaxID=1917867 RepID=UPI00102FB245|nr:SGNH/GDSL hydrolase family protein [Bacilliculturomica massiliensis]